MRQKLALVLAACWLGASAPAAAQPWGPPPSEAEIDRFIAALPNLDMMTFASQRSGTSWIDSFRARNARREAEANTLVRGYLACMEPASHAAIIRGLRRVAHDLGSDRLERLTRFYAEGKQARYAFLGDPNRPETAAESQELREMLRAYPVRDFVSMVVPVMQALSSDPQLQAASEPCRATLLREASRRGLAFPREPRG